MPTDTPKNAPEAVPPPPPPIRAIVWDLGGVLVDWNPRYLYRSLFDDETAMENFLAEIQFTEWNLEQDRGRSFADAVIAHSARFPHHAALIRAYNERYLETLRGPIGPTVELLAALHRAGYPLYALTNWAADTFVRARPLYPFLNWFKFILVSGEVKLIKPDPRIYALLLQQTGTVPNETLFIDDSAPNIAAAAQLGFRTIRYESAPQLADALHRFGLL